MRVLLPIAIAVMTIVAFLPALDCDFVIWDDDGNILDNPNYQGFTPDNIKWMFTTFHMGHFQPLTWLSYALDYRVWEMNPFGYHLTNLLLHAACAVVFYFLCMKLLLLGAGRSRDAGEDKQEASDSIRVFAAFAALLFAIHPLRAEAVAWVSNRNGVLSSLLLMLAVLTYVLSTERVGPIRRRWYVASLLLFTLSLLTKTTAVVLPVILFLLDVYPLRRLSGSPARWFGKEARRVLWEKVPYALLALPFIFVVPLMRAGVGGMAPLAEHTIADRVAQAFFGLAFYLWKTVVPVGLIPLYRVPIDMNPLDAPYVASAVFVIAVSVLLVMIRHRAPWLLAVWVSYIVLVLPVLGLAQSGTQIAADRYTYLSCLGWAVLVGGAILALSRARVEARVSKDMLRLVVGTLVAIVFLLGLLTWHQTKVWQDSFTLWNRVLAYNPRCDIAHKNLGEAYARLGDLNRAIACYEKALRINPAFAHAHNNLGDALARRNDLDGAVDSFRKAIYFEPRLAVAHFNLGIVYGRKDDWDRAIESFGRATSIRPRYAEARSNLGVAYARKDDLDAAIEQFGEALRIDPGDSETHKRLALAFWLKKDHGLAWEHVHRAQGLGDQVDPDFLRDLNRAMPEPRRATDER